MESQNPGAELVGTHDDRIGLVIVKPGVTSGQTKYRAR